MWCSLTENLVVFYVLRSPGRLKSRVMAQVVWWRQFQDNIMSRLCVVTAQSGLLVRFTVKDSRNPGERNSLAKGLETAGADRASVTGKASAIIKRNLTLLHHAVEILP